MKVIHIIEIFILAGLALHVIPQIPAGTVHIEQRTKEAKPKTMLARLAQ